MRLLLITPPMTQLNTPYPATAYLTGFLRQHAARLDLEVVQADAAIELFLKIFSRAGLQRVIAAMQGDAESVVFVREHAERYVTTIDAVVRFLQNKDPGLAPRITARDRCPRARGSRRPSRAPAPRRTIRSAGRSATSARPTARA